MRKYDFFLTIVFSIYIGRNEGRGKGRKTSKQKKKNEKSHTL
jgi:hypothetical protein